MTQQILETLRGSVVIRPGQVQDWQQYRTLRLEMLRAHPAEFLADYTTTEAYHASFWQERLRPPGPMQATFFAAQNGELVGMVHVQRRGGLKSQHNAEVYSVYVKPEWRGLRIAGALLDRCALWAKRNGVTVLKLTVVDSNKTAIHCFERNGFATYGTEPHAVLVDGNYFDDVLMARILDAVQDDAQND